MVDSSDFNRKRATQKSTFFHFSCPFCAFCAFSWLFSSCLRVLRGEIFPKKVRLLLNFLVEFGIIQTAIENLECKIEQLEVRSQQLITINQ